MSSPARSRGLVAGFVLGFVVTGAVWLVLELTEGLPSDELVQIVPWALMMAIIRAGMGCPVGAAAGGLLAARGHLVEGQQAVFGAAIGLVIGGVSASLVWNLRVNGPIALLAIGIMSLTGALVGALLASRGDRACP